MTPSLTSSPTRQHTKRLLDYRAFMTDTVAETGLPVPHPALHTRICALFGVRYPIVQTGMGWVAGPRLTAATANAGAGSESSAAAR